MTIFIPEGKSKTLSRNDSQYEDLLVRVLVSGARKSDRTGTGTRSVFGAQLRYDLGEGFPLITTKRVWWKGVVGELIWMLSGDTNIGWLRDNGIHIWDEWADEFGELGPVYGAQWRNWNGGWDEISDQESRGVDQISEVIDSIRTDPDSRRHVVSAWNPSMLYNMALPPCHALFQFYVADGKLSCQLYQRSADLFLGVPFNIASYALLTHMVAQQTGLEVGEFIWTGGDCHIYDNHEDQVREQLSRSQRPFPELDLSKRGSVFDYRIGDAVLVGYDPHPAIVAPVAV